MRPEQKPEYRVQKCTGRYPGRRPHADARKGPTQVDVFEDTVPRVDFRQIKYLVNPEVPRSYYNSYHGTN